MNSYLENLRVVEGRKIENEIPYYFTHLGRIFIKECINTQSLYDVVCSFQKDSPSKATVLVAGISLSDISFAAQELEKIDSLVSHKKLEPSNFEQIKEKLKSNNYELCNKIQSSYGTSIKINPGHFFIVGPPSNIDPTIEEIEGKKETFNLSLNPLVLSLFQRNKSYTLKFDQIKKTYGVEISFSDQIRIVGPKNNLDKAKTEIEEIIKEVGKLLKKEKIEMKPYQLFIIEENKKKIERENDVVISTSSQKIKLDYRHCFGKGKSIEVHTGNIVSQSGIDAIVNAANEKLENYGGIAGAISRAVGFKFEEECKRYIQKHSLLPTGRANHVSAGNLHYKYVINTVGPKGDTPNGDYLLSSSVKSALQEAETLQLSSIAIPLISTGIFGFDLEKAVEIITSEIYLFLQTSNSLLNVRIVSDLATQTSLVCSHLDSSIGSSNTFLEIVKQNVFVPSEPEYHWKWEDDYQNFELYHNLHHDIELSFQNGEKLFDKWIDNQKYTSGVYYSVIFSPSGDHYQINKQTGFKRRVLREKNPNFTTPTNSTSNLDILNIPKSQSSLTIEGFPKNIKECLEYCNKLGVGTEDYFDPKNGNISKESILSICESFHIESTYDSIKKGYLLRGSEQQIIKAKKEILSKIIENTSSSKFPSSWVDFENNCELFVESPSSQDYIRIEKRIRETLPSCRILKIERVQNKLLWKKYCSNKELIVLQKGKCEVKELFHGTRSTDPSEVYDGQEGFDMRFCNQGMWGIGTYFAQNASYSMKYSSKNNNGHSQMFLSSVLVGEYFTCPSNDSLRMPPKKQGNIRYDSVSGNTNGSDFWVVYGNGLAYPSYLITFQV
eukprot:TRINITY_DN1626_c0_g1_i1.p1 TRINITY_DN1626_c0_g1~~TRINITY_DN1626_c0_g1_i1.p1  ORF type:complete len:848 (-),score=282.41 TRINITY_DN1626_c0_g1_i1:26-2533(-)